MSSHHWLAILLGITAPTMSAADGNQVPWPAPAAGSIDLSAVQLDGPADRLLVNLMMEGRLAWFSWMNQLRFKPKLSIEWSWQGRTHTKSWQHDVDGSEWPQAIFLLRGTEPGHVRWGGHADLGAGREGHKHHFFAKDAPGRCGFVKADLSEIPSGATIVRAEIILHIHDKEGLKAGGEPEAQGIGRFRHVNKDWDWNYLTFTHYAAGQPWTTPTITYPYLGHGDVSPVLWSLDRQRDLADRGYHKNGVREYPLDLTAYVVRLQHLRSQRTPSRRLRSRYSCPARTKSQMTEPATSGRLRDVPSEI